MNRLKQIKAGFITCFFLLTLAFPLFTTTEHAEPTAPSPLGSALMSSHAKEKPNWNKNHYNWKEIAGNNSYVDVILSLDSYDLNKLDKRLQKTLEKSKDHVYKFAIQGFNARLSIEDLEQIQYENPQIQIMPDLEVHAFVSVNQTGADAMWNRTLPSGNATKGNGITVAVIDTGIYYNHVALGGGFGPTKRVIGGWDFVNNDSNPVDDMGHGTHCAGIIGANGTVLFGMAPEVKFYAVKVLNSAGSGSMSDVAAGIEWAMDPNGDSDTSDHADVLSISLGGAGSPDDVASLAVDAAVAAGAVVCVAAGNDGPYFGTVASPGLAHDAITVGSVDSTGTISSFSSRGTTPYTYLKPEVCAPGYNIYSTYFTGGYKSMSGTSMSTPHVAGAAALLIQPHHDWSPSTIKSALIAGCHDMNNSIWYSGAGQIWVPWASDTKLFSSPEMVSYGVEYGVYCNISVNSSITANYTVSSTDFHSVFGNYSLNGSMVWHTDTNLSAVNESYLDLGSGSTGYLHLNVPLPPTWVSEGYYEGRLNLSNALGNLSIPFGFALVSSLTVISLDLMGNEIYDLTGYCWAVNKDDPTITRADYTYACGVFHTVSGNYTVHSWGQLLVYTYSTPFLLSADVHVDRLSSQTIYLQLSAAKKLTLELANQADHPIYVSDFRLYWRFTDGLNLSLDRDITDYSIERSEVLGVQKSKTIYVSTTNNSVGFAIMGYGYSDAVWDFTVRNYDHWLDNVSPSSPSYLQSIADEIYLLSWEFRGINDTAPAALAINWSLATSYQVKYDLLGNNSNPWCNWGENRQPSGMATKWQRRDTDASVFPIFPSNITLTVQGPHLEVYFPQTLTNGHPYREFFLSDWNHTLSTTTSGVDTTSREYLLPIEEDNKTLTTGKGPIYVSARMENTNSSLVLYHPLYTLTSGERWSPPYLPNMYLYRGGSLSGVYQLSESTYQTSGARRNISTSFSGIYYARMTTYPAIGMCTNAEITLRWQIPGIDRDPPYIESFDMPQRFLQGDYVNISFQARDDSTTFLTAFWRNGSLDSWHSLTPTEVIPGLYNLSIVTSATTATVDIRLNISDTTGNYVNYTLTNVSRFQVPVDFDLTVSGGIPDIVYSNNQASVVLWGNLTVNGTSIHPTGGVLLELYSETKKVGLVMDEYIDGTSHSHNGTIRFVWNFNPTQIFSGPGESKMITSKFDLGTYEVRWANFTMNTTTATDLAPVIELVSPANNSIIENGTDIDLDVTDEFLTGVSASLDGFGPWNISYPRWRVSTSNWSDGTHTLSIRASDLNTTSYANYTFYVDSLAPVISIISPINGTSLLDSAIIQGTVADNSTTTSWWSINGVGYEHSSTPYSKPSPWLSLVGWANGWYNVSLTVYDVFGHQAYDEVNFNITSESPTITNYPILTGVVGYEYSYNSTSTAADIGVNAWVFITNATWLNLNFSDQTHGFVNGIPALAGSYWANISVSDTDSGDYINWTILIGGAPPPPSFTSTPDSGVREDHAYDYLPTTNQTIASWSWATNASGFLTFNSATGEVSGTADNSYSNRIYYFNITATNPNGTVFQNTSLTVWNLAPAFTPDLGTPPVTGVVGRAISYNCNHSDEGIGTPPGDFDGLTTNFTGAYTFNTANGYLNFTPSYAGELWWNITGNDRRGVDNSTNYQNWTMEILEKAPYITSSSVASTIVWTVFYFNCSSTLPDLGITTWNHTTNATWLSFIWGNQTRYNVSGTPVVLGSYWLNFSVNDSDSSHYLNFSFSVVAGATPVFTSSPPLIAYEDNLYFYQAVCDDHIDTWSLLFNNATWATWNPLNGSFMGTPDNTQSRMYFSMYISATNMNGTEWQNWWVVVYNRAPVFSSSPIISAVNNSVYSYNSTTDDEFQGNTTYSVNSNASFAYNIHALSGEVTFTPDVVCIIWVNITCNDGTGTANASWSQNFTVTISDASPLIQTLPGISVVVWVVYRYNATCTAPDSGPTVWILWTDAPWLTIVSGGDGFDVCNLSGLPTALGVFWVNLTVSDGDSSSYINWSINVLSGPHPNIISTPSLGVTEDFLYFYLPVADQPVTWVLAWADGTWLVFDPLNGSLMGIPDNTEAEFGFNIWLRADTMNGSDTQMWGVFVYNNPPIFTTAPADLNGTIGVAFTYDPTTTDESIGATAYTVTTNTTDWYTIDATTGQLIFDPTIGGSWWFDIQFDDFSAVANATAHQNFTITVLAIPHTPPGTTPSTPSPVSVSFKYVIDGATVHFSDNSYGNASYYIWNFGDGRGSTQKNPDHTYDRPGIYNVTLTVIGKDNRSYTLTTRIAIEQNPMISGHDGGWNIVLTDTLMIRISAVGSLVLGAIMFASAVYMPSSSFIMTNKGRKVIGVLMVVCGISYYIFIDNSWWG